MGLSRLFIEAELRWFFTEAEGALGARGVNLSPSGGEPRDHEIRTNQRHTDCLRWSRVAKALRDLPPGSERVLSLAYTPHHWEGLERWYERAGVAALIVARERAERAGGATPEAVRALRVLEADTRRMGELVRTLGTVVEYSQACRLRIPVLDVELDEQLDAACTALLALHEQLGPARARVNRLRRRVLESVVDAGRLIPRMQTDAREKLEAAATVVHRDTLAAFSAAYQGAT